VTQQEVIDAVMTQLRSSLGLNTNQVFEVIDPLAPPSIPPGGDFFVTLAVAHGTFAEHEQVPGNVTEDGMITVTGYSRIKLDSSSDTKLLHDDTRGLLVIKRKILKALVGVDLQTDAGARFLRELVLAKVSSQPNYDPDKGIGWLSMDFGVSWDWDIT